MLKLTRKELLRLIFIVDINNSRYFFNHYKLNILADYGKFFYTIAN